MSVSACMFYMSGAYRGQKRALDPLELELQTVVNCHMGAGNQILIPLKEQPLLLTWEPFSPALPTLANKPSSCSICLSLSHQV